MNFQLHQQQPRNNNQNVCLQLKILQNYYKTVIIYTMLSMDVHFVGQLVL